MPNVVLITGCSTGMGGLLAAIPFSGRLVVLLRGFVWGSVLRQMFKINPSEIRS